MIRWFEKAVLFAIVYILLFFEIAVAAFSKSRLLSW